MSQRKAVAISSLAFGTLVLIMANCSDEECRPCAPKDTTAPAAVNDLGARVLMSTSVTLSWLSPGDDGDAGTAFKYDIRCDTDTITEASWNLAGRLTDEPAPIPANSFQELHIEYLPENTRYFFALMTEDENGNWSALSNVPSATTLPTTGLLEIVTTRCVDFQLFIWIDDHFAGSYPNNFINNQPIAIEVPLGSHTLDARANIVVADTSYCWTRDFVISEGQRSAVLVLDCIGAACPPPGR